MRQLTLPMINVNLSAELDLRAPYTIALLFCDSYTNDGMISVCIFSRHIIEFPPEAVVWCYIFIPSADLV